MSEKMTLLAVKDFGHVLGAITRVDEGGEDPEISAVVGDEFVFWDTMRRTEALKVPAGDLEVVTVDLIDSVLNDPQGHGLVDGKPMPSINKGSIVVLANQIDIDLQVAATEDVEVQVRIDDQIPITGTVPKGDQTINLFQQTAPGDHDVLLFAIGFRPILQYVNV